MNAPPLKAPSEPNRLRDAAERFGTPTYAYVESILRRQCERLRRLVAGLPAQLLYAAKANANPAILRVMQSEGLGLDVVSPGEMELALRLGFAPDKLLFSATGMTDAEMQRAVEAGVLPNIGTLSRLDAFGQVFPGRTICVRINPKIGAGHHAHVVTAGDESKFGIPVDQLSTLRDTLQAHDLHLTGLHQHIGSGIHEPRELGRAVRVLLDIARTFEDLTFINVGGGLGTPHRPEDQPLDIDAFREGVIAPLQTFVDAYPGDITIRFEPGRYLTAEAGVLLIRVTALKSVGSRTFALTDSGMNHLIRPALYDAYHAVYNLSNPDGPLQTYEVVGNICESGDVLARDRPVQTIREGDVLAVLDAGAYGMAMASTYNLRPLPAEVMIRPEGALDGIRCRRSPAELAETLLHEADSESPVS